MHFLCLNFCYELAKIHKLPQYQAIWGSHSPGQGLVKNLFNFGESPYHNAYITAI